MPPPQVDPLPRKRASCTLGATSSGPLSPEILRPDCVPAPICCAAFGQAPNLPGPHAARLLSGDADAGPASPQAAAGTKRSVGSVGQGRAGVTEPPGTVCGSCLPSPLQSYLQAHGTSY